VSDDKKEAYFKKFLGRELEVLVQEKGAGGSFKGLSRNYIPVHMTGNDCSINSEVRVKVREITKDGVSCDMQG